MKTSRISVLFAAILAIVISGCSSSSDGGEVSFDAPFSLNATAEEIQAEYIDVAVAAGDVGMCLKIPNRMPTCLWTSSCLAQVAEHNKDEKICSKIIPCEDAGEFDASDFAQEQCISGVERAKLKETAAAGPDACMQLEGESKNECLSSAAVSKADYAVCELIEDDDEARDVCLFNAIDDAVPENKALCDKIKSTQTKDICHKLFTME